MLSFTSTMSSANAYAMASEGVNSESSTCVTCENQEKGEILTGQLKEKYIKKAINDDNVSSLIQSYEEKGYNLVIEDSQVGKSLDNIVGTTLVLSKETDQKNEYAYILYNDNTGQVDDFDKEKIEEIINMSESEISPRICLTCIIYCAALVEVPVAFAACIAFCAGAFC